MSESVPAGSANGITYASLLEASNTARRQMIVGHLWQAATDEVENLRRLWEAVRDLRALLPESDPARTAPVACPAESDARDSAACKLAQRVIDDLEPLPKTIATLEERVDAGVDELDAARVERIRAIRSLGELAFRSLVRALDLTKASAGWWVYVDPPNSARRARDVARLVSHGAGDEDAGQWCAAGAAALVLLERAFDGEPENWRPWKALEDLVRSLPESAALVLEEALHTNQPTAEMAAALGRVGRGETCPRPPLNDAGRAIAELVFNDGPLTAKQIAAKMPPSKQTSEQNVRRIFSEKLTPHYGFHNPRDGTGYHAPRRKTW